MDKKNMLIYENVSSSHIEKTIPNSPVYNIDNTTVTIVSQYVNETKNNDARRLKDVALVVTSNVTSEISFENVTHSSSLYPFLIQQCFEGENLKLFYQELANASPFFQYLTIPGVYTAGI